MTFFKEKCRTHMYSLIRDAPRYKMAARFVITPSTVRDISSQQPHISHLIAEAYDARFGAGRDAVSAFRSWQS